MRIREGLSELTPAKILLGYFLFGGLWILTSDWLANSLIQSQGLLTRVQTIKGWIFVFISGVLILGLVETRERQLQSSRNQLRQVTEELRVLHRVFRHDIRNDLNVIRGHIEIAQEEIEGRSPRKDLERAYDSTDRVLDTCEMFRKVESAHEMGANFVTVDIMEITEQERERLEVEHPEVTVNVDGPDQVTTRGDRSIGYAIRELFENAIRHHDGLPETCRIEVEIWSAEDAVLLEISDNGPGIESYEIEALEQGKESPLLHSSGVGLWFVKWLCNFSGGELDIENASDGGTVARLTFQQGAARTA